MLLTIDFGIVVDVCAVTEGLRSERGNLAGELVAASAFGALLGCRCVCALIY